MNTHSTFLASLPFRSFNSPDLSTMSRHAFQMSGSERISARVCLPASDSNCANCASIHSAKTLDGNELDVGRSKRFRVGLGDFFVGDGVMHRGRRSDKGQAAISEFAGIADDHYGLGVFDHYAIYPGFQQVRSSQTVLDVESVDREKQQVGGDVAQ